jgi:hypothetical protein
MNTYDYASKSRTELAEELIEGAGYSPADHVGMTAKEKAQAIDGFYRELAASGESPYPTWDDGDEINIAEYVERYFESHSDN